MDIVPNERGFWPSAIVQALADVRADTKRPTAYRTVYERLESIVRDGAAPAAGGHTLAEAERRVRHARSLVASIFDTLRSEFASRTDPRMEEMFPWNIRATLEIADLLIYMSLPAILGTELFAAFGEAVGQRFFPGMTPTTAMKIIMSRQNGKSTLLAIYITVLILCARKNKDKDAKGTQRFRVYVYASVNGQSESVLSEVKTFLARMDTDMVVDIKTNNTGRLVVRNRATGTTIEVRARSCKTSNIRGDKPDVIIVDEYCFIENIRVYKTVLLPLMQNKNRICICASTPALAGTYFYNELRKEIMEQHSGVGMFRMMLYGLVCDDCAVSGCIESCRHLFGELPPWKTWRRITDLMAKCSAADFVQEILGYPSAEGLMWFTQASVNNLRIKARAPLQFQYPGNMPDNNTVFTGIDPTGGGFSQFAITSTVFVKEHCHIIGLTYVSCRGEISTREICQGAVVRHFTGILRAFPALQHCQFMPIPEGNPVATANEVLFHVQGVLPADVITYYPSQTRSMHMDERTKIQAIVYMQRLLDRGLLSVPANAYMDPPQSLVDRLCDQLGYFRYDPVANKHTGKTAEESDDLAMSSMIAVRGRNVAVGAKHVMEERDAYDEFRSKKRRLR